MATKTRIAPRTALFLPASNPRAIAKARTLSVDLVILDLEDAVKEADKRAARDAAREAAGTFGETPVAIRVNGAESPHHKADLKMVRRSAASYVVLPKVEQPKDVIDAAMRAKKPQLAMIESAAGVMNVGQIACATGYRVDLAGLIVGPNDLAHSLKLPPGNTRPALALSLQLVVLAARSRELWALDGVYNRLDDPEGLAAQCREGRALGFDGKTLIHPNQIDIAREAYSPTPEELEEAQALIEAASGGAERFRDRMIEDMHVDQAREMLARAGR